MKEKNVSEEILNLWEKRTPKDEEVSKLLSDMIKKENNFYLDKDIQAAYDLLDKIKDNKEYAIWKNELENEINKCKSEGIDRNFETLKQIMSKINNLIELDKKINEKSDIVKLFKQVAAYFKNQEVRNEDLINIENGELFEVVEEIQTLQGKRINHLQAFFITRKGAYEFKSKNQSKYEGILKLQVIDNKDELLEKILRLIEKYY